MLNARQFSVSRKALTQVDFEIMKQEFETHLRRENRSHEQIWNHYIQFKKQYHRYLIDVNIKKSNLDPESLLQKEFSNYLKARRSYILKIYLDGENEQLLKEMKTPVIDNPLEAKAIKESDDAALSDAKKIANEKNSADKIKIESKIDSPLPIQVASNSLEQNKNAQQEASDYLVKCEQTYYALSDKNLSAKKAALKEYHDACKNYGIKISVPTLQNLKNEKNRLSNLALQQILSLKQKNEKAAEIHLAYVQNTLTSLIEGEKNEIDIQGTHFTNNYLRLNEIVLNIYKEYCLLKQNLETFIAKNPVSNSLKMIADAERFIGKIEKLYELKLHLPIAEAKERQKYLKSTTEFRENYRTVSLFLKRKEDVNKSSHSNDALNDFYDRNFRI